MTIYVCFYDEDTEYDTDVNYDGFCPPESISIGGVRSQRPKKIQYEYCQFSVKFLECYIYGNLIDCNFAYIEFECEEEVKKIPNFNIESIKINVVDLKFEVEAIKENKNDIIDISVTCEPKVKVKADSFIISAEFN